MNPAEAILARLAAGGPIADRVMIVVAHPDDETIGLGAQLSRFTDALLVHVTDGAPRDGEDARNYGFASVADYAAARQAELTAALRVGDAAHLRRLGLGIPDKEAWRDLAGLMRRIDGRLRTEAPAAVFTHAYEGGHPDHDAAAFAVHAACRLADAPPAIVEMPFYHRREGRLVAGEFLSPLSPTSLSSRRPSAHGLDSWRKPGSASPPSGRLTSAIQDTDRCPHPSLPRKRGRVREGVRQPDASGSAPFSMTTESRSSRGRQSDFTMEIRLSAEDRNRKRGMIDSFATQLWLLERFDLSAEQFRVAPEYEFREPPHPGELHYETLGWGIAGADWRRAASDALDLLGLDTRCR